MENSTEIRDRQFIELAIDLAKTHFPGTRINKKSRLCAVIASRGKLICYGFNRDKTHPLAARYQKNEDAIYMHAELNSILYALKEISPKKLKKATLYVGRVKGLENSWGLAKPCLGCQKALKAYGIKRIVYSTNTFGKYEELLDPMSKS